MDMRLRADCAAFIIGLGSLSVQTILIRRLMAAFSGNELTIGLTLAAWLLFSGLGSWAAAPLAGRVRSPANALALVLAAAAALTVPLLLATARAKTWLGVGYGELAGPFQLLGAAALITLPVCLLFGFAFSLAARMGPHPETAAGRAYRFEAAGAFIAGIVLAGWFAGRADPVLPGAAIALVIGLAAALIAQPAEPRGRTARLAGAVAALLAAGGVAASVRGGPLSRYYAALYWEGRDAVESFDSRYSYLAAVRDGGEVTIFQDGTPAATFPDPAHDEVLVHLPLIMCRQAPGRVLLIGGGFSGAAREVLKHPIEHLDYAQLDPGWIALERRLVPAFAELAADPRVAVRAGDGRTWLRRTEELYDAVIVDLPDPYTAGLSRFYTAEFFAAARGAIYPGGVLAFRAGSSPPNRAPSPAELALAAGAAATAREFFDRVLVLPLGRNLILAGDNATAFTTDPAEIDRRLARLQISSFYAGSGVIAPELAPGLLAELEAKIAAARAPVDRDLRPRGYLYGARLWAERSSPGLAAALARAADLPAATLLLIPAVIIFISMGAARSGTGRAEAFAAALASGFAGIAVLVALLTAFQVAAGSVYFALALLSSCFMAGLGAGAWAGEGAGERTRLGPWAWGLAGWPALAVIIVSRGAGHWEGGAGTLLIFGVLLAGQGALAGGAFAAAGRLLTEKEGPGRAAALVYGLELFGSAAGGLAVSAAVLPLAGVMGGLMAAMLAGLGLLGARALLAIINMRRA